MNESFKLRLGTAQDIDQLFVIYMNEKVNHYLNFEITDINEFKEIFDDLMNSGDLYVYECNNQIVATCIVIRQKRRANHVVSLGTLATHPHFQRKGIGTRFINELINHLKVQGIKRIDLCTETDNLMAHSFYKKLGFQQEGILKKYYKRPYEDHFVDEYLMALIFDE